MGGNEYGISGHLHIFSFLKHFIISSFEVQFFKASCLYRIIDIDIMHDQLRCDFIVSGNIVKESLTKKDFQN